jgi:outer membrane protein assembly factor BamB
MSIVTPSSPTIGPDGTVYFGSGGTFFAVDGHSGQLKWKYGTNGETNGSPVIGNDGTVYMSSLTGIYSFEPQLGILKWQLKYEISSDIVLGQNDTLYAGLWNGKFMAIDGTTGKIKWQSKLDKPILSKGTDQVLKCPTISPNGIVYANTQANVLYAWNSVTGNIIWKKKCGSYTYPAISSDGHVYLNTSDSTPGVKMQSIISILDGKTGKIIKTFIYDKGIGTIPSPFAVAKDGTLIVNSNSGRLYAIH